MNLNLLTKLSNVSLKVQGFSEPHSIPASPQLAHIPLRMLVPLQADPGRLFLTVLALLCTRNLFLPPLEKLAHVQAHLQQSFKVKSPSY